MTVILIFILTYPAALYAIIFMALLLAGIGLPLPDEVTFIFAGYLASLGFMSISGAIAIAVLGLLAADTAGYMMGKYAGAFLARLLARSRHASAAYEHAAALFARYGDRIVALSRPLFGIRVAVPIFAGHARMPFRKFIVLDALTAIPWAIFFVVMSYYVGSSFDLFSDLRRIKHYFFLSLGLAIIITAGVRFMRSTSPSQ